MANGVPADSSDSYKPRATLISVIGSKPYDALADLCSPVSPSCEATDCSQREGESVATFAANLKHLSTCDFGTHLNEALRDRFVCGLRGREFQKRLLTEEHTFDEALKIALGAEAAEKDVVGFSQNAAALLNKLDMGTRRTFRTQTSQASWQGPGKQAFFPAHKCRHSRMPQLRNIRSSTLTVQIPELHVPFLRQNGSYH